ncbi:MAG: hypothetical protein WCJ42_04335 [Actinomycetes bacterium]
MSSRSTWHIGAGAVGALWLLMALATAVRAVFTPSNLWLPIHLLLLGALSNAVLIWSTYFSEALLRLPRTRSRVFEGVRLATFNFGAASVVCGVTADALAPVVVGAGFAMAAVLWHGSVLLLHIHRSLPSRFGTTVRYYVAASAFLPIGIGVGVVMAAHDLADSTHARNLLAHAALNLLGWIGLTVMGTLVTLWPTMLHTQVVSGAEKASRRALPVLATAVVLTAIFAVIGNRQLAALALAAYLVGLVMAGSPLVKEALHRRPTTFATCSVGLSLLWYFTTVALLAAVVAAGPTWSAAASRADRLAAPLLVGFGAQLLIGALSYLVPVILGGGPTLARSTLAILNAGAPIRLVALNGGVVASVLPLPSALRFPLWLPALVALGAFFPLVVRAVLVRHRGSLQN